MQYVEFLEFFGRLSNAVFLTHEELNKSPLYLKIDALLSKYCKHFNMPKLFTYLPPHQ